MMEYTFERKGTEKGVGWFSCEPKKEMTFESGLEYSRAHPNDQFMRKHLLDRAAALDPDELAERIDGSRKSGDFHLLALCFEAALLYGKFDPLRSLFSSIDAEPLAARTPLIYIRWAREKDTRENLYWLRQFSRNANLLAPLPGPDEMAFPIPFSPEDLTRWRSRVVSIRHIASGRKPPKSAPEGRTLRDAARRITAKLERSGVLSGWETRPDATLSPYAVERPWNLDVTVRNGRNHWRLTGSPVSYGRGLNIHQGRISCVMEAVERYSAFAAFDRDRAVGFKAGHRLVKGRYSDLVAQGLPALDPNEMCLEVPYRDQEIHWVPGERMDGTGGRPVYVPAQFVFLFPNLDEVSLTSGLPSNGLAAGSTIESARLASLLEVLERDAEKVVPFSEERCFLLEARDRKVSELLEGCARKGIHIRLMDMTSEFGVPCYRAFVQGPGGVILKGTGAHLDGKRAAVAAMTEIPYPYPYWFGSMPAPRGLDTVSYEDLPDYSTGSAEGDLRLLEKLLLLNGYHPVYVDLTREDTGIPVVKTLVPGLEILTVLDRFSSLGIRQFGHYPGISR